MIEKLSHVAVSVPDMQGALNFYRGALSFSDESKAERDSKRPLADRVIRLSRVAASMRMLKAGSTFIELWQFRNPALYKQGPERSASDLGLPYSCLHVRDIAAESARPFATGMSFIDAPASYGDKAAVYGRDPFDNIIELLGVDDRNDPAIALAADDMS